MLKIYTLKQCTECTRLVEGLSKVAIEFKNIDAESNLKEIEQVENLLNSYRYPIALIEKQDIHIYIGYGVEEGAYFDDLQVLSYTSIPHLISLIKQNV